MVTESSFQLIQNLLDFPVFELAILYGHGKHIPLCYPLIRKYNIDCTIHKYVKLDIYYALFIDKCFHNCNLTIQYYCTVQELGLFQPEDFKELLNAVCKCLVHRFNETSPCLEYQRQKGSLAVMADLCQNINLRRFLLKQPAFCKTRSSLFFFYR